MGAGKPKPRVLVVEDEYFIAEELCRALELGHLIVVGPVPDVAGALRAVEQGDIDATVLDLNLDGKADFSVAAALSRKEVPFVFATGYDAGVIPPSFTNIRRFEKPYYADALVDHLKAMLGV